jgi:hypothetical protein|nr:hypothetical protein [uncultured Allomuricauda sp.]
MKKLILIPILLATLAVVFGGMNAYQKTEDINMATKAHHEIQVNPVRVAKYDDCILEGDFPEGYLFFTHDITYEHSNWDIIKVNESIEKYRKSLDSTLKNLSTVDAHDFIHQAFLKSKNAVENKDISVIQKHYHGEIMRICYARDQHLNQNTIERIL